MIYYFKYRLTSRDPGGPQIGPRTLPDIRDTTARAKMLLASGHAVRGEGYCEIFDRDPETGADPIETVLW